MQKYRNKLRYYMIPRLWLLALPWTITISTAVPCTKEMPIDCGTTFYTINPIGFGCEQDERKNCDFVFDFVAAMNAAHEKRMQK